jgi:hypothetical protein
MAGFGGLARSGEHADAGECDPIAADRATRQLAKESDANQVWRSEDGLCLRPRQRCTGADQRFECLYFMVFSGAIGHDL